VPALVAAADLRLAAAGLVIFIRPLNFSEVLASLDRFFNDLIKVCATVFTFLKPAEARNCTEVQLAKIAPEVRTIGDYLQFQGAGMVV
jgi:hypothetical protein